MARNSQRRQFVWSRVAGTLGGGLTPAVFGTDLLANIRVLFGDAVLRGATVMGIKGYVRPNAESAADLAYVGFRAGIRIGLPGEVDDEPANVRELGPFFSSHSDWMLYQQAAFIASDVDTNGVATSNVGGSPWAVETRANRKMSELGETLLMFVDAQSPVTVPFNTFFADFDLSIGLKLP